MISFGIIGTNFISDYFADAVAEADARICALYSRTAEKGAEFASRHGIKKVYTELDAMLEDDECDAIYVASPTMLHKEQTIRALNHGRHVLTEKMIALNHSEFIEMRAAAERNSRVLSEAMRPDFDELLTMLPKLIARLGRVKAARLDFRQYSSRYDKFKRGTVENAFDPRMKNSALADIGIYPLHLAIKLFGEPVSLNSSSHFLENGFEGEGEIQLHYEGFNADILYSKIYESDNISYIECEGGVISFGKINEPDMLTLTLPDGRQEKYTSSTKNMVNEVNTFIKMIRGECDFVPYLNTVEKRMRTVDNIYESSMILKNN